MKAIIISRVSTEEQKEAGSSLPAQTERLKSYFNRKEIEIESSFEFDESAYKDHREKFDEILDLILNHKEKIAVGFDKVDRLSRNVFDQRVSKLYEKVLKDELEIHFVSDGQVITSNISAVEKFQLVNSLGLAKYFSDAISDNVKRAREQQLRNGQYPHKAPYGYENYTTVDGKKDIRPHLLKSQIIKKVFEYYSTDTYSFNTLLIKLHNDFGVNFTKGTLDSIFNRHFYHGLMEVKGKTYPHRHGAIITESLFSKVQTLRKKNSLAKGKKLLKHDYVYRRMLKCGICGLTYTPSKHKGIIYYHCTQHKGKHPGIKWLREDEITKQLSEVFARLEVPEPICQKIRDSLRENHKYKIEFQTAQRHELEKERAIVQKRRDNNYRAYLDERITADDHDKYDNEFRDKLAEIDIRLSMLQEADDKYFETVESVLSLTKRASQIFESSNSEAKSLLINMVLLNLTVDNEIVRYEAKNPFNKILELAESSAWGGQWDLNPQPPAPQAGALTN